MSNLDNQITLCNRIVLDNKDSLDFTRDWRRYHRFHLIISFRYQYRETSKAYLHG